MILTRQELFLAVLEYPEYLEDLVNLADLVNAALQKQQLYPCHANI